MTEHIVAVFASDAQAESAERDLVQAGVPRSAIRRYTRGSEALGTAGPVTTTETSGGGGGFWAWLLGEEPQSTRAAYPQGADAYDRNLDAGHFVLSVTLMDDSRIHEAVTILDRHDPLDMDERTEESDDAGSSVVGTSRGIADGSEIAGASGVTGRQAPARTNPILEDRTPAASGRAGVSAADDQPAAGLVAGSDEEVLPIAEEQLEVGKRVVDRGTRRVRRYVVETPVEREVTLHGERVTIERRRPAGSSETGVAGAFEERVVEVHETEEVPDVRKTARVVEEVAIRREATERKETIRDTVRRDEVEMAPEPADKRQKG